MSRSPRAEVEPPLRRARPALGLLTGRDPSAGATTLLRLASLPKSS